MTLSRLAYDLETLLSPTLAAAALLLISYDALFAVNALAFLASAGLVISISLPAAEPHMRATGVLAELSFGTRAYLATPRLRGLLALSMAVAAAGSMVIVNTVVYVRDQLGRGETDTALAFAAAGLGSMALALLMPFLLDRSGDRPIMLGGGVVLALGLGLALLEPDFWGLLTIWMVLGAGSSMIQTPAGRLLRRSCHAADRPALYAAQFALSHACWLIAYPLSGWLGASFGLDVAFGVLALVVACSTLTAARLWPVPDPIELGHDHDEQAHAHPHMHDQHHRH